MVGQRDSGPIAKTKNAVSVSSIDHFLDNLEVKIQAFAICEIEDQWALQCPPLETAVVHFVLKGRGAIEWAGGAQPIEPGTVVVVPKHVPKRINGAGPITRIVDTDAVCPLSDGIVQFRAAEARADLILGCCAVSADLRNGPSFIDSLAAPLFECVDDPVLPMLLGTMLAELSAARAGTRAIVTMIMRQILALTFRSHSEYAGTCSPLAIPRTDTRLARAALAMTQRPEEQYTLASLARIAGMSRTCFAGQFPAIYGLSPMRFLQSTRLDRAAQMLAISPLPIKAIATAVGYASRSHFANAFRERFGVEPSQYRRSASVTAL